MLVVFSFMEIEDNIESCVAQDILELSILQQAGQYPKDLETHWS